MSWIENRVATWDGRFALVCGVSMLELGTLRHLIYDILL